MKIPQNSKKAFMSSLKNVLLCSSLIALPICYASDNDLLEDTPEATSQQVASSLNINDCAKSLGILIEELQKKKEIGIYIKLRKESIPKDLQPQIKVYRKGVLCTEIRTLYNSNKVKIEDATADQANFSENKAQASQAENNLRTDLGVLTAEEQKPLIDQIYQDLGFANKGHFYRLLNQNKNAIKSLNVQNQYLLEILNGGIELTHVPHQEIIDYLYNYPRDGMNVRKKETLTMIKEALECFFPE